MRVDFNRITSVYKKAKDDRKKPIALPVVNALASRFHVAQLTGPPVAAIKKPAQAADLPVWLCHMWTSDNRGWCLICR
jgi:hypothetical protein